MFMDPKVYADPLQHAGLRHQCPFAPEIMCLNIVCLVSAAHGCASAVRHDANCKKETENTKVQAGTGAAFVTTVVVTEVHGPAGLHGLRCNPHAR